MKPEEIAVLMQEQGISQSELSRLTGISRPQINRIVSGKVAKIRSETAEKLAKALRADDIPDQFAAFEDYTCSLLGKLESKSFAGLGLHGIGKQPLEAIYVAQPARSHPLAGDGCNSLSEAASVGRETFAESADSVALVTELLSGSTRSLVLGCPGAGKSTLLEYLAVLAAKKNRAAIEVPLLVRLPEFALAMEKSSQLEIVDWVCANLRSGGWADAADALQLLLNEQSPNQPQSKGISFLFLLDGLDEVPSDGGIRQKVVTAVGRFAKRYPSNRIVVTSRLVGFDGGPWNDLRFSAFRIVENGPKEIRDTIERWAKLSLIHI